VPFIGARASDVGLFLEDGSVFYFSPNLGGLELAIGGSMLASNDDSKTLDTTTVSARYNFEDLYVSATYVEADNETSDDGISLAASYDFGIVTVAGSITDKDIDNVSSTPYELVASFNATDELTLKLAYADSDLDVSKDTSVAVEATYAFGSGVTGFVGYAMPDDNFGTTAGNDILSFGVQVVF